MIATVIIIVKSNRTAKTVFGMLILFGNYVKQFIDRNQTFNPFYGLITIFSEISLISGRK